MYRRQRSAILERDDRLQRFVLDRLVDDLITKYSFLDRKWALRLVRAYGTEAKKLFGEDVVWRRTKLGLRMSATEVDALDHWMSEAKMRAAA